VNVDQLIAQLDRYPRTMEVAVRDEGDVVVRGIVRVEMSAYQVEGQFVLHILGAEVCYEEPDMDDDFPVRLEYHDDDPRDDEVAREEAAMEREMGE
jgi:hypothetical protein